MSSSSGNLNEEIYHILGQSPLTILFLETTVRRRFHSSKKMDKHTKHTINENNIIRCQTIVNTLPANNINHIKNGLITTILVGLDNWLKLMVT